MQIKTHIFKAKLGKKHSSTGERTLDDTLDCAKEHAAL